jgi:xylose dehydrogenase (NAD/NADP)
LSLRLGLLSTAKINGAIIRGAGHTDAVEVVAVASRDGERARAYASEHGIPRAHDSYEDLLADPEVDAVYISLPNSMHVDWSIRALEAGKHVLCEKPLTRHPEDAERAFDAAERAGKVLMEAFMWRHTPQAAELRAVLPRIGELRVIRAQFSFGRLQPGNVRLSRELEGGALMDVGCYCISGARYVAGAEPIEFAGQQVLGGDGVDIAFTGLMRFPGDVLCHFDCAMNSTDRAELEVVGTEGRLLLRDPWHTRRTIIEIDHHDIEIPARDPYTCELEALASGDPGFGREDAVGQARAIQALYEAAR